MYQLKGFINIETLVSNVANVIAPIGELSTYSTTFAKDKGIYTQDINKSISLVTFSSKSTLTGIAPIPSVIVTMGLKLADWIYTHQMTMPDTTIKATFMEALMEQFTLECAELNCGELIEIEGGHWFPEWITWKNRNYIAEDNLNKVWFSDSSFKQQYDEFEIVVIPPIANIDYFFQPVGMVTTMVNSRNFTEALELIRIARNDLPETILSAEIYDYVNPNNSTDKLPTNWSVLIYGPTGNDPDLIASAISEYVLSHSEHVLAEWKIIFPDIFKRTEFIIFPRWNNYSIDNMTLQAGIYSSVVNMKRQIEYIKIQLPEFPPAHIDNYSTVMPNPYKCLMLDVIGGYENRDNLFEINQIYPDIINVVTTSNDFNRMSAKTQGLLNLFSRMIPLAETMTAYTDIPVGMRRTVRNGIMYLVVNYYKVQYLISTKLTTP